MMLRLTFWLALAVLGTVYAGLKLLIHPPVPASVVTIYMVLTALAILIFVAADERRFASFAAPLAAVFDGRAPRIVRWLVLAAIPLGAAWATYARVAPSFDAPFEARMVHPEPPASVTVHGRPLAIAGLQNPLRTSGPEFDQAVAAGKTLYYQNCFFCHGDALSGDGHFAPALRPIPANFRDIGTISMLQESYVFWRVSSGGPGLPKSATPWHSAMPVWQEFLSEDEIWKVILYIYAGSGSTPRTWDEEVKHDKH